VIDVSIKLNYQLAQLRVCVDSVTGGRISGRITGQRICTPIDFIDISDFISKIDAIMDSQKYPQSFQRIRSFTNKELPQVNAAGSKETVTDKTTVDTFKGEVSTFVLQILSRKNATWQGSILWLDRDEPVLFSSTLELLKLVDSRLMNT